MRIPRSPRHRRMMDDVLEWLMGGDPSIRWQTERDLLDARKATWGQTRKEVALGGWGKALLDQQDLQGTWGGGLYVPKWTSTTYTLLLLRRLGLPSSNDGAGLGCARLLDDAEWVEGGVSYWSRPLAERCVNGMVLSIVSYFDVSDRRIDDIAELLIRARMADGGWNCRDDRGATHSSFHTTISVLEGLVEWRNRRQTSAADAAIVEAHEFLVGHHLFRSHRTGEVIDDGWKTFHFPPRWHYDILRGLDHMATGRFARDSRVSEAIEVVRAKRRSDGRWGKGSQYSGETFFVLEPGRVAGRWNTLRALRVLRWWEGRFDRALDTEEGAMGYGLRREPREGP